MKIDTAGLRRRLYNFGKKTKDKTRRIMERFTVDAENKRRAIYNAGKDKDKRVKYIYKLKGTKHERGK
tara:strand:+ start:2970 stop:3173 length:204 start_codon:yes stop_codon:yes gene_type:complete